MMQSRQNRQTRREAGFTLIEIMVVVVILGLLATVVAQNVFGETDKARLNRIKADLTAIKTACGRFRLDHNGKWPDEINALVEVEEGKTPYLDMSEVPQDPWGNEYYIDRTDVGVVVASAGPDGQRDSEDDINSNNMRKYTVEMLRQFTEQNN